MKVFAAVLAFAVLGSISAVPAAKKDLADDVKDIVNLIFAVIPEDIEAKDIELVIPENDFVSGELDINEIRLSKLHDITIDDISLDTDTLNFQVHFDDVVVHLNTLLNFVVLDKVEIKDHELDISIDLENLSLTGDVVLNEDQTQVTEVVAKIHLEGSEIVVSGVLGDDALSEKLSTFLSSYVPEIVNTIADEILDEFDDALKNLINDILGQIDG